MRMPTDVPWRRLTALVLGCAGMCTQCTLPALIAPSRLFDDRGASGYGGQTNNRR